MIIYISTKKLTYQSSLFNFSIKNSLISPSTLFHMDDSMCMSWQDETTENFDFVVYFRLLPVISNKASKYRFLVFSMISAGSGGGGGS